MRKREQPSENTEVFDLRNWRVELAFAEMNIDILQRNVRAEVAKCFCCRNFLILLGFSSFFGGGWR